MQTTEQERAAYIAGNTNQADLLGQIDDLQRDSARKLPDGDYVLTDGAGWFEVGGFVVRIRVQPTGLVVDAYEFGGEMDGTLDTMYVELPNVASDL
jgi:hypothetical protein